MTIVEMLRMNPVFAEIEKLTIRNLREEDREEYFHTLKEVSTIPAIYETEGFEDTVWKDAVTSATSVTFAVERKDGHKYVGDCMIKNPDTDMIEVGLDVSKEYQNQGIGSTILRLLVTEIKSRFPEKRIITRVYSDNDKSQRLIHTIRGVKIGEEPSEYDAAMSIMKKMYEEMGISAPEKADSLSSNHIDIFEL